MDNPYSYGLLMSLEKKTALDDLSLPKGKFLAKFTSIGMTGVFKFTFRFCCPLLPQTPLKTVLSSYTFKSCLNSSLISAGQILPPSQIVCSHFPFPAYIYISLTNTTCPPNLVATVQKIISEILSGEPGMAFTREARDVLIECCVEFLTLISSEANEIAEKECKKTIATEHIEMALRDLGFPEYVEQVLSVAEEHKEQLKVCPPEFSSLLWGLNGAAGKVRRC